jgi:hypothetical protein
MSKQFAQKLISSKETSSWGVSLKNSFRIVAFTALTTLATSAFAQSTEPIPEVAPDKPQAEKIANPESEKKLPETPKKDSRIISKSKILKDNPELNGNLNDFFEDTHQENLTPKPKVEKLVKESALSESAQKKLLADLSRANWRMPACQSSSLKVEARYNELSHPTLMKEKSSRLSLLYSSYPDIYPKDVEKDGFMSCAFIKMDYRDRSTSDFYNLADQTAAGRNTQLVATSLIGQYANFISFGVQPYYGLRSPQGEYLRKFYLGTVVPYNDVSNKLKGGGVGMLHLGNKKSNFMLDLAVDSFSSETNQNEKENGTGYTGVFTVLSGPMWFWRNSIIEAGLSAYNVHEFRRVKNGSNSTLNTLNNINQTVVGRNVLTQQNWVRLKWLVSVFDMGAYFHYRRDQYPNQNPKENTQYGFQGGGGYMKINLLGPSDALLNSDNWSLGLSGFAERSDLFYTYYQENSFLKNLLPQIPTKYSNDPVENTLLELQYGPFAIYEKKVRSAQRYQAGVIGEIKYADSDTGVTYAASFGREEYLQKGQDPQTLKFSQPALDKSTIPFSLGDNQNQTNDAERKTENWRFRVWIEKKDIDFSPNSLLQ